MKQRIKLPILILAAALLLPLLPAQRAGAVQPSYTVSVPYGESEYYDALLELELTGNYRADLVNVALTQVGYHEGSGVRQRHGGDVYSDGNWTEYGYFCGCDGYAWCAMFVSWCARQARIPGSLIQNSTVARSYAFGLPFYYKEDYSPRTGDVVFFAEKGHVWDHVGIVLSASEEWMYSLEGNARNQVRVRRYAPDDEYIKGYGVYAQEACDESLIRRDRLYVVNFDLNGGEGKRTTQIALEDACACFYLNEPDEPDPDSDEPPENNHWCWREGCDFLGWYIRRDRDGCWHTAGGWQDNAAIRESGAPRTVWGDGDPLVIDSSWSETDLDTFTAYAVWADRETGLPVEDSAYIYRTDDTGWAVPYRDLEEESRYYAPVKELIRAELVSGVSENLFGAQGAFTRAQLMTLLYRAAGCPAVGDLPAPPDAEEDAWYRDAACWALARGLLEPGEGLEPDAALSREELIRILQAMAVSAGKAEDAPADGRGSLMLRMKLRCLDPLSVSDSCLGALVWAQNSGLLRCWGLDGRRVLLPRQPLTRLEACGMVSLFLQYFA